MKKTLVLLVLASLCLPSIFASGTVESLLREKGTVQYFTDQEVADEHIEMILKAGVASQSGMNSQPWHFSAITDRTVLEEIASDMSSGMGGFALPNKAGIADAPLAIVISAKEGNAFDAGLACQSMAIQAIQLGYGVKILGSPVIALNGEKQDYYRKVLGIPDDMSALDVLIVGAEDAAAYNAPDAVSSASLRNDFETVVTLVE